METTLDELKLTDADRDALENLRQRLSDVLGTELVSMILFGPWTKGSERPGSVGVFVVLREVSTRNLERIAPYIREGILNSKISLTVMAEEEVERSTDVFPVKFLDMQNFHVLLHGKNVFDEILIAADNLRLRCEQQSRNTLLRLRSQYVHHSHNPQRLRSTMLEAAGAFFTTLNAFSFLVNGSFRRSEKEIAESAAEMLKLDSRVLQRLVEIRRGGKAMEDAELTGLYESLLRMVKRTADIIDQYATQDGADQ